MKVRILSCLSLLLLAASLFAADPTLPELFKRAKDKFAAADYKGSLADFELLDNMSSRTGFENDRNRLLPVVTFYRGANLAALGRKVEAQDAFATYLGFVPTAAIASPPFPKTTVDLFEQARKEAATRSMTMSVTYAAFAAPAGWKLDADEHWIESPTRYILTPAQKKEYATFTSNAERATFIEAFWKQLDPTPTTDENEFRNEFERRVAFADRQFSTPKVPGRITDSATVFTFLGPPTYASVSQLATSQEMMGQLRSNGNSPDMAGLSRRAPKGGDVMTAESIARARGTANTVNNSIGGVVKEDNLETDTMKAKREAWYYRQGRLPQGVPYKEVRFDFLSKEGYGMSVLQKDPQPMQTLGMVVEAARRDRRLN
jgi:GWxTD domain-containing protein